MRAPVDTPPRTPTVAKGAKMIDTEHGEVVQYGGKKRRDTGRDDGGRYFGER